MNMLPETNILVGPTATSSAVRAAGATTEPEDHSFASAHGTVMIFAWIVFASTAILFARYGRKLQIGSKEKLLGDMIWFQGHRTIAFLATVATLLGFFLILVQTKASWVKPSDGLGYAHSVLGGIIVCCALVQAWMALFRCHQESRYRFIFNWMHRLTGVLAFLLSIPAFFTTALFMDMNETGMIVILSIWSVWVVIIFILMEFIQFRIRQSSLPKRKISKAELNSVNAPSLHSVDLNNEINAMHWNKWIIMLIVLHLIVSIALAIPLVVLVWVIV